jgi:serine phosphatase RsbU (regulator of sigma subunit)
VTLRDDLDAPTLADPARLAAVEATGLTNEPDHVFDAIVRLTRRLLKVPVALVSLVTDERQCFPGAVGLPEPWASARQTPLSHSFCQHVVTSGDALVVTDAHLDSRVQTNLAVTELGVTAYAGVPLLDAAGNVLGSLCAIDAVARIWSDDDLANLAELAEACSGELVARIEATSARRLAAAAERARVQAETAMARAEHERTVALAAKEATDAANARLDLMARVTARLAGTLDPQAQLDQIAALLVPALGDHCVLEHWDDDGVLLHRAENGSHGPGQHEWEQEIRSRHGEIGVLRVGAQDGSAEQQLLAREVAARLAAGLENARLYDEQRQVAVALQESLLPQLPHHHPDVELAGCYRPAADGANVGGDWYDAFTRPDGTLVLTVGDVVGHDLAATGAMAQLRAMLRAVAYDRAAPPGELLSRLDLTTTGLGLESLCTVVVGTLARDPDGWLLTWSSAGHPPGIVLRADGTSTVLDASSDLMIGVLAETERTDHVLRLQGGDTLLWFTDGLVERRGEPLDAGLERVGRAAGRLADLPVSALCRLLVREMIGDQPTDDTAVLGVRLRG